MMKRTVFISVDACGGNFVVWAPQSTARPPRAYDDPTAFGSAAPRSVTFERGGEQTPIATTVELVRQLHGLGSTAAAEFARDPLGFARLAAALLDLRRLVDDPQLFDFLEGKYGIPLARRLPHADAGALRFTIAQMAMGESPIVVDVVVDATSGRVEQTAVSARQ